MSNFQIHKTVVVGIDGSEVANDALKFAAGEALRRGARLIAVHVGEVPHDGNPRPIVIEVHEFGEILRTEAVATVAELYPTVHCETVVREGNPAAVLIDMSKEADLVVVGTHRTGRLRGFVLGSVSQRVAAHAHCPVMTISGEATHDDGPVVLGVSSSEGGLAAMRFACEEARIRGTSVHAVRAAVVADWTTVGFAYPMAMTMANLEDSARASLDKVVEIATAEYPDVHVIPEMPNQDPFVALLKASDDAALLVLGARRDETADLPHLGPISAWLLHQAQCPLVVVNHVTEAAGAQEPVAGAGVVVTASPAT